MKDDNQVDDLNLDEMDENANGDKKERHGCATAFIIVTVLGSLYNIIAFITGRTTKQLETAAAQLRMAEMYEEAEGMDRMIDAMQAPAIMPMGVTSAVLITVGLIMIWRWRQIGIPLFLAGSALSMVANWMIYSNSGGNPWDAFVSTLITIGVFFWAMSMGDKKTINQLD
ncbi:hypothetical protein CL659_05360 [bacterium]|nr:hypothetical protein [bacterium]|tara:strand:- start:70186 stop:70695 length:510 start_codon:yes stop_codon:yes gene_type:complete